MIIVADGNQDSRYTRKDYSESSKIEKEEQKSRYLRPNLEKSTSHKKSVLDRGRTESGSAWF